MTDSTVSKDNKISSLSDEISNSFEIGMYGIPYNSWL